MTHTGRIACFARAYIEYAHKGKSGAIEEVEESFAVASEFLPPRKDRGECHEPHRIGAQRSLPHRHEPADDGGGVDLLSRPPALRTDDGSGGFGRFDVEI